MPSPEELARRRVEAIAELEAKLASGVGQAQQLLWEDLLARLQDIHADPGLLPVLLQEYANTVLVPLAAFYGESLLMLSGLNVAYFQALDLAGYQALRKPLADFLAARLGIDAAGGMVPGGYLASIAGDTTVARQVLQYAYSAQASGVGLNAYRDGLNALVLGSGPGAANGLGVVEGLYRSAADDFSRNDRALQVIAGKEMGLQAYLYQGGLIDSSRPFCVARNGKCFTHDEIELFGTSKDAFGGYTNKKEGLFSGKTDPYDPFTDCGGHRCRHTLHGVPNLVALRMRADLMEGAKGQLVLKPQVVQ